MTQAVTDLLAQAMALTETERAALAYELLKTLPDAADEEVLSPEELDDLWEEELDRRVKELEDGTVKGIPAEQVMDEIRRACS